MTQSLSPVSFQFTWFVFRVLEPKQWFALWITNVSRFNTGFWLIEYFRNNNCIFLLFYCYSSSNYSYYASWPVASKSAWLNAHMQTKYLKSNRPCSHCRIFVPDISFVLFSFLLFVFFFSCFCIDLVDVDCLFTVNLVARITGTIQVNADN